MQREVFATMVVIAFIIPTTASAISFGDWASDQGYNPGDTLQGDVDAGNSNIDSLDGIGDFQWGPTTNTLNLVGNQLSNIRAGDFNGLSDLTELYLDGNQLASIEPGGFAGLDNLATLSLSNNQLSSIGSGTFSGLSNLMTLDIWSNQLASIEPSALTELANLTFLQLGFNQLTSIGSTDFSELTSLTTLQLGFNQLTDVNPTAFSGLTSLEWLHLGGNQLSSIDSGTFSGLGNLSTLQIENNETLTDLNMAESDFSNLNSFFANNNAIISSVSLKNSIMNQDSLAAVFAGYNTRVGGIGNHPNITEMDLSGIDFTNITDLLPLYTMDNLTDLHLFDTQNLDAVELDILLDNLATIEGTETEGVLYMTQANFDAFNIAGGGLLSAWDSEPGHHVAFTTAIPGDLNSDGFVDGLDLGTLLGSFDTITTPDNGELNGIPPVDGLDLGILLGAWNPPTQLSIVTVPEPSTVASLMLMAVAGLITRRGRRVV